MSGVDLRRRTHGMHLRRRYAGLPYDPTSRRVLLRWGVIGHGDYDSYQRAMGTALMDTVTISKDAFIQGLAFVLALGALTAFIAWSVLALANLWRAFTS